MMGQDGEAHQSISFYEDSYFIGYTSYQQVSRPFRLAPDRTPRQPLVPPRYLQHMPPLTPFILFPEGYKALIGMFRQSHGAGEQHILHLSISHLLVQVLKRSFKERTTRFYTNCALRRLTYPFGAYWPHIAHIEMHQSKPLARLELILLPPSPPEGLIHFLIVDRATCIIFSNDDLPPEGLGHIPLCISVLHIQAIECRQSYWTIALP